METRGLACLATKSSIGIYSIRQRAMCLCAAGLGRRQRVSVRNKHEALVQLYTASRRDAEVRYGKSRNLAHSWSFHGTEHQEQVCNQRDPPYIMLAVSALAASAAALSPTLEGLRVTPLVRASDAATVPLPSLWRSNTPFGIADEVSVCAFLRHFG